MSAARLYSPCFYWTIRSAGHSVRRLFTGLAIAALAWLASRSLRRPVVTGVQTMVGSTAEAIETFMDKGKIRYGGEIWNALTSTAVSAGQIVRITRVDGLTVWVEPV